MALAFCAPAQAAATTASTSRDGGHTVSPAAAPSTFAYDAPLLGGGRADILPTAVDDSRIVTEDDPATPFNVLANDTNADGGPKLIASVTQSANSGTVVITASGSGLTYQPAANYCNTGGPLDTFSYTLNGGSSATVSVAVRCVDDQPVAVDDTKILTEDAPPGQVYVRANDTDVDGGPAIIVVSVGNPAHGTAAVDGHGLTYEPDPDYCNTGGPMDTFTYTLRGGSSATVSMHVRCVDDPPVAFDDTKTLSEDMPANQVYVRANDTDVDGGPAIIVVSVSDPAHGTAAVDGHGLTYQPDPDYCNTGGPMDTFTYTLRGGSSATVSMRIRCVEDAPIADDETFDGANAAVGNTSFVVDAPPDGPPSVSGPKKVVTGDILAGDADPDGPGPLVVSAGSFSSAAGGTVVLEADGDFTFTPAPGSSCISASDFFDYTISDQTARTDTGRVTISFAGCVWYARNDAPAGTGTSTAPFDTLAAAESASGPGHTIFVFDGDNTTTGYSAGIDLKADQRLIGEAATLQIGSAVLHAANAGARPKITDNNADVVALASNNTVRGIEIDPQGTGGGIAGGAGDNGGTIGDVRIVDTAVGGTQASLELSATTGTFAISDLTVDSSAATGLTGGSIGVLLSNAGSVNFAAVGTNSITTVGARGLAVASTNMGAGSVFDEMTVTGSASGGVSMINTSGTTTFGDGSGTDLALATSGAAAAFLLDNAGAVTVPSSGTANVNATGGPAVDVSSMSGPALAFDSVSSTSSATSGIRLTGLGSATFSVTGGPGCTSVATCSGGAIQNATSAGIDVVNVGGSVTLAGMYVSGGSDDGIRATTVDDIDVIDSAVVNNGNSHAVGAEERGLDYLNVTGTPQILRTTVSGSDDSNAHIRNTVGTTALGIGQSTFSDSKTNAGLRLRGEGPSVMNATVTASVFSLNADPGFSMEADSPNAAQQTLRFDDNDVSGGSANAVSARPQISISAGGNSAVKATVTNNDIKSAAGHEIILNTLASHTGTFDAKVNGNDIGDSQPGTLDPLPDEGTSIDGWAHGDGVNRMEIRNNTIADWGRRAMGLSLTDGMGDADYTVTGNALSSPDASVNVFEGISVVSGAASGDASDVCVDMESNDMDGIGRNGGPDIALDHAAGNVLRFADFNDTSVANLQTNLRGKNVASPALTVQAFSLGPDATTDTACDLPVGTP